MIKNIKSVKSKIIIFLALSILLLQTSCGYVLHPERRNQRAAQNVDVKIVAMDGIGLLFFILPGVIAFGVDIASNTIYLPSK